MAREYIDELGDGTINPETTGVDSQATDNGTHVKTLAPIYYTPATIANDGKATRETPVTIKSALEGKSNKNDGVYYVVGTYDYPNYSASSTYTATTSSGPFTSANSCVYGGKAYFCKTAISTPEAWNSGHWTAIPTPVLTGTIDGVTELYAGLKIAYKFSITGGSSSTYLNINNLGNKYIRRNDGNLTTHIPYNSAAFLVFDGTYWWWADYDSDNVYSIHAACGTAASTAAKAATAYGYVLTAGETFLIRFSYTNTYAGKLTLDVNSQGAKDIWINGSVSSASNYNIPAGIWWCHYDGTVYHIWTDGSVMFKELRLTTKLADDYIASATTWNAKQDALATQTAYSAKGTATKVPQITTNSLGQVTGITEVTISGVTPASHAHGNIANGGTLTDTAAAAAGNDYVVIRDADNAKIQTSTIKGTDVADAVSKKHSHSTLTLSTTAQAYDGSHTLALPSTDPYTSARTPASHSHGNIANDGKVGTTADYAVVTTTGGAVTATSLATSSPSTSGNTLEFIDTVSQNSKGKISATKKKVTIDDTYSSTGTNPVSGKAIAAAIETLDVTEVGGDGKYIKKIKEDNGKITATVETMDTTPTASSTKAVTSGGVKTALDSKVSSIKMNGSTITPSSGVANIGHIPTTYPVATGTAQEVIQLLRVRPGGSIGSVNLKASTISSTTIAAGWYNYMWIPHRTGAATDDFQNFGSLFLTPLTSTPNLYIVEGQSLHTESPIYRIQQFANATHTHGNIQNDGTLQTDDVTIANGDKLVITDASDSDKVARASAAFDGSTTSKVLTQKGTFESMSSITPVQYYLPSMEVTSDDFDPSLYSRYQMIGGANGTYSALYLMYDITEFCDGTIVNISAEMSSFSGTIIEHRVGGYPYERITNVTMAVSYGNPLTSSNCRFLSSDSPRLYPVIVKETVERNATWTTGAYTFTEGAVPTAVSGASSRYTDIACSAGQEICVSANISSTYKSWAFLDASGKVISISSTNKYNGTLTAPENAAALRVQISSSYVNHTTCGLKLSTPKYYLAIRTTSGSQSHVTYCGRWYTRKTASASYAARPLLGIYRSNLGEESAANLPAGYEEMAGPSYVIKAGTSVKLATDRELAVSLSNTSTTTTFDGSANVTNIKVTGTLPISKGGTGATTKQAAEYAINGNIQASTAAMSDDNRIVFSRIDTQSAQNGVFIYKTGSTMWNYFKGKMSSDTGVNISGNSTTSDTAKAYDTSFTGTNSIKTALDGKADDSTVVHKAGEETITGNKVFKNGVEFFSPSKNSGYGIFVLPNASYGTKYANWDSSLKDGAHFREWTLHFPAGVDFWGRVRITFLSGYSGYNASGCISKTIVCAFNGSTVYNNTGAYDALGINTENEFRISDLIWDNTNGYWTIKIHSIKPSSDNSIAAPRIEFACESSYVSGARQITWSSTSPSIVTDTTYYTKRSGNAATAPTSSGVLFNWDDKPVFQSPYGYEIFDRSHTIPVSNGGTGKTTVTAAEYNLLSHMGTELTGEMNNDRLFAFAYSTQNETNGRLAGYRKASTVWSWIKGKLTSDTGVNISGNAATASAAQSGSALETAINAKQNTLTINDSKPITIGTAAAANTVTGQAHTHDGITSVARASVTNIDISNSGTEPARMTLSQVTSATTQGTDPGDGYVLNLLWDNAGNWDTQIYVPNSKKADKDFGHLKMRYKNESSTWGDWEYLPGAFMGTLLTSTDDLDAIPAPQKGVTGEVIQYYWKYTSKPKSTSSIGQTGMDATTGLPSGTGSANLFVFEQSNNRTDARHLIQLMVCADIGIWVRRQFSDVWSVWSKVLTSSDITTDTSTKNGKITIAGSDLTVYVHPAGSAASKTGVPTANATPAFGGTFKVNQITTDSTSHVSAVTERTITIPNTTGNASTAGLTKLYTATGTNTDGTMTQNAIKSALDTKMGSTVSEDVSNELQVVGVQSSATSTLKRDSGVTVQGGAVKATTFKLGTNATITYNSTTEAIDFTFL